MVPRPLPASRHSGAAPVPVLCTSLRSCAAPRASFASTGRAGAARWPWLGALALLVTACSSHADHTRDARNALDRHDAKKALELYNKQLDVTSGAELPKETGGDNALLLLDRSLISQQLANYKDSSQDLQTADK